MPKGIPKSGVNKGWIKKGDKLNLGNPCKESVKNFLRNLNTGKKLPDETKRKISQNHARHNLGKKFSAETRSKMSLADIGRKHTEESKQKISRNLSVAKYGVPQLTKRGENNPRWKGGITSANHKVRHSLDYVMWKRSVFTRDDYVCQKTGVRGGQIVAHHIKNFSEWPDLRFSLDNGITLSKKSHEEFHRLYGVKGNTLEQVEEFIKRKIIKTHV